MHVVLNACRRALMLHRRSFSHLQHRTLVVSELSEQIFTTVDALTQLLFALSFLLTTSEHFFLLMPCLLQYNTYTVQP